MTRSPELLVNILRTRPMCRLYGGCIDLDKYRKKKDRDREIYFRMIEIKEERVRESVWV